MAYYNDGYPSDIISTGPQCTNSTLFTECCGCAIMDDEIGCPQCGREVVGDKEETERMRHIVRWRNANRDWPEE
jgi:hypothetical protein